MDWVAVGFAGFIAITLATALFWAFRSLGWTIFSPTTFLGCLWGGDPSRPATDTIGLVSLYVVGAVAVPAIYSMAFEALSGPSWQLGAAFGALHGILFAAALPLFGTITACVRGGAIPQPRWFGIGWGWFTPLSLIVGHVLYGGMVGAILASF